MHDYLADLHIHSRFSRATSRKLNVPLLAAWARLKGIAVLGTGDFTHPRWREELGELLVLDEASGLYVPKDSESIIAALPEMPVAGMSREAKVLATPQALEDATGTAIPPTYFMLQGEISSIYKRGGKVRKVHNLVFMPTLDAAERFSARLGEIGNLHSDGRPIVGLDSKDLLEMVLETDPQAFLIPAHIWTPWFSLFGSKSGFDSMEECFGDLAGEIFALETGLSSDPAMNRLWSGLDKYRLVSNSDAHSGENLAREANVFSGAISYSGILQALKHPEKENATTFRGTVEFFPEEGKYHMDGHRKCNVVLTPEETRKLGGICPVCGGALTVGVFNRVMELADRELPVYQAHDGAGTSGTPGTPGADDDLAGTGFVSLVPLPEILGEVLGVGSKSRKVSDMYVRLLERFGPELNILRHVPEGDIARFFPPLGEAISRMRRGDVQLQGGYDGEYGVVRMFSDIEREEILRASGNASRKKKTAPQALSLLAPLTETSAPQRETEQGQANKRPANENMAARAASDGSEDPDEFIFSALEEFADNDFCAPSFAEAQVAPAQSKSAQTENALADSMQSDHMQAHEQTEHSGEGAEPSGKSTEFSEQDAQFSEKGTPRTGHSTVLEDTSGNAVAENIPSEQEDPTLTTGPQVAPGSPIVQNVMLESFNQEQERAIIAGPGPVLVLAGPGTGKTHTLISRILHLLDEGIGARKILAVTFTRRAASEMDSRLSAALGEDCPLPRTDTLHALALELWHKTNADVPLLLSEDTAKRVFAEANPEVSSQAIRDAWQAINLARERLEMPPPEYIALENNYKAQKNAWNLADYTDLLEFWLEQISGGLFSSPWSHILVDEVQDLSPLQLNLVRALHSSSGEGFFGIGDPDQSIYGFRGAHGQSLEFFRSSWPGLEVISLTRNYRSRGEILNVSHALLGDAASGEVLIPQRQEKANVHLFTAPSAEAEAQWIAERASELIGLGSHTLMDAKKAAEQKTLHSHEADHSPGDIAILVRTHALGKIYRKVLGARGIPVSEPAIDAFWEDERVGLILRAAGRMLGIAMSGEDEEHNIPVCPDKVLANGPLGVSAYLAAIPPFDDLFWRSSAFRALVKAYDTNGGWSGLTTWISLQTELELVRAKGEKVQVLSLHAAKGLEFRTVFLPCLEDGLLPFAGPGLLTGKVGADNEAHDTEEERRLLYVGMTRAKDFLFLSHAAKRTLYGRELRLKPSRFLSGLPEQYISRSALIARTTKKEQQLSLI